MTGYVVRPLKRTDLEDVLQLRALAGPGFTSLAAPVEVIEQRIAQSEKSFVAKVEAPGEHRYWLGLEDLAAKQVVGLAGVKAQVGLSTPFFNFRILRIAQASASARRRFDMDVLVLVNEFAGATEVGALFVHPAHRGGAGRLLAQTRYMLIALAPQRFAETVVSELRGQVDAAGASPFWEALGRCFFRMDFIEADRLSASTDNQFILDLMPKYPIYVDLLDPAARAVIGQAHPEGGGARRLLEEEGFRFDRVVDIFDGGPLLSTSRDALRTVREARRAPVRVGPPKGERRALVARPSLERFRCVSVRTAFDDGDIVLPGPVARALGVKTGDDVLAWVAADER